MGEPPHRYYDREEMSSLEGLESATLLQRTERSPRAGNSSGRPQVLGEQGEAAILVARKTPSPAPPAVILTSAGYDHTIRFWDVIQGACIGTLQHNESQVNCLALSRDKLLLAAGGNPAIRLYDVIAATTMQISSVGSAGGELRGGAMAASDSSLTAATTTANILPVHIFETSATTGQSGGSGGNVISVAFHPEGSWLWSASEEGQLRVWDLQGSFGLKKEIHLGSPLTAAVLHPDYEHVLVGDELGRLRLIHMDLAENERAVGSGEVTRELGRMSGQPKGGGTSSSSSTVILNSSMSASLTPRHRVQVVAETRTSQRVAIRDMAISSDGTFVAAIDHRGQLHLWRLDRVPAVAPSTSSTGETGSANGGVRVTISTETDDPYTATMTEEQPVYILEFVHVASVNAHGSYGIKCMFSPDTTTVLTTSADTTARLWAMPASGGPPVEGKGDGERGEGGGGSAKNGVDSGVPTTGNISAVDEVSREGSKTSSTDHITASANLLIPPPVPSTSSREVSRSGSPSILTAPSSVISSLPLIQEFIGHTKWVWDCAFSADSAYVITASSDESIRLWDVNSGLSIATYAGHSKAITCVALNDLPLQ